MDVIEVVTMLEAFAVADTASATTTAAGAAAANCAAYADEANYATDYAQFETLLDLARRIDAAGGSS